MTKSRSCPGCGVLFVPDNVGHGHTRKYHSRQCWLAAVAKACKWCGTRHNRSQKFCTTACGVAWRNKHDGRRCPGCGVGIEFTGVGQPRVWCNDKCKDRGASCESTCVGCGALFITRRRGNGPPEKQSCGKPGCHPRTQRFEFRGRRATLVEISAETGLPITAVRQRTKTGKPLDDPRHGSRFTLCGKPVTLTEVARVLGLSKTTMAVRLSCLGVTGGELPALSLVSRQSPWSSVWGGQLSRSRRRARATQASRTGDDS